MNIKHIRAYLAVCCLVVVLQPLQGLAQQNSGARTKQDLNQLPRNGMGNTILTSSWVVGKFTSSASCIP